MSIPALAFFGCPSARSKLVRKERDRHSALDHGVRYPTLELSGDVVGRGRYSSCRYPWFTFLNFEPIFGFGLYQYMYVTQRSSNGTYGYVIWEPCTRNAVTDAYVRRSWDLLCLSFLNSSTKFLLFFLDLYPHPHISLLVSDLILSSSSICNSRSLCHLKR